MFLYLCICYCVCVFVRLFLCIFNWIFVFVFVYLYLAVALRAIRLIVNRAPYLDRCWFCTKRIIAAVGIGSFIFLLANVLYFCLPTFISSQPLYISSCQPLLFHPYFFFIFLLANFYSHSILSIVLPLQFPPDDCWLRSKCAGFVG